MDNTKQIIFENEELKLGNNFDVIKEGIENDKKRYGHLRVCKERGLVYSTERIYPTPEHSKRIPVLFLFSNPHPESVENRLFLSEPHSRTFWQRLFESRSKTMKRTESATATTFGPMKVSAQSVALPYAGHPYSAISSMKFNGHKMAFRARTKRCKVT